jgi:hypothetical protein
MTNPLVKLEGTLALGVIITVVMVLIIKYSFAG